MFVIDYDSGSLQTEMTIHAHTLRHLQARKTLENKVNLLQLCQLLHKVKNFRQSHCLLKQEHLIIRTGMVRRGMSLQ